MRLNRRVPNGTHGGVRGRGYAAPPTRLFISQADIDHILRILRTGGNEDDVRMCQMKI